VLGVAIACSGARAPDGATERATAHVAEPLLGIGSASAYWTFDDCNGGATLQDAAGNGFGATKAGGVTCVQGHNGWGVSFDGSTGALSVPDNPAFEYTNAVTIAAWVNPSQTAGLHTILNKWYAPDSYMLLVHDGRFEFSVALAGTGTVTASAPAAAGVWTHVAGVFNGSTITLYVNAVAVASMPAAGTLQPSGRPLSIGSWPSWNAFAGVIDEVWLSGDPFNAIQIGRLAYGGRPALEVAAWRFDDCASANPTLIDSTGHGYNATKSGGVTCTAGFAGAGAAFDGATGVVQVPDNAAFHFTDTFSVAAWVNPTQIGGLHTILNKWYAPDSYMLLIQDGRFEFMVTLAGGGRVTVRAPATAGVWTHVAGVFDGSRITLFVNAVAVASAPAPGLLQQSNRPLCIGSCPSWNAFAGTIDEVWLSERALTATQVRRLAYGAWPNAFSSANSDPWIVQHHDDISEMHPRVLALNFADQEDRADAQGISVAQIWQSDVNNVIQGLNESSRYRGYRDPGAPQFLQYTVAKSVDFGDQGNPPPGWNHRNSSKLPIKCDNSWYQFDYSQLFSQAFAQAYGFPDPANPGQYLDLCQLVDQGIINEVWVYYNGRSDGGIHLINGSLVHDPYPLYLCPDGTSVGGPQVPDAQGQIPGNLPGQPELTENKQMYDASNNVLAGQFNACAGNGCLVPADAAAATACGKSIRIMGFSSEVPMNALHNLGHGWDNGTMMGAVPYLVGNLEHFLNFDYTTRSGVPFPSCYAMGATTLAYPTTNSLTYSGTFNGTMSPYNQGCGNTHCPSNANSQYDYQDATPVLESCEHYGMHDGPGGTDLQDIYTNPRVQLIYQGFSWAAGVEWFVYWRQSFPGLDNPAYDTNGNAMKNWWPFLYY
jgi:hypothetical protein